MNVKLKDLKLNTIRKEIKCEDGGCIKVFNATGEQRERLLRELLDMVDSCSEQEFCEYWYKYLIKNFTDVEINRIKINTLLESPTVQFLELKRSLDEMVNEVYLDMLFAKMNELEQQKILMHTQVIGKQFIDLNNTVENVGGR